MALTYVCSPLSAPTQAEIMVNAQRARTYMTMCEREFGCRAVAPHAYLPYLLDDSNPEERALALSLQLQTIFSHSHSMYSLWSAALWSL